MMNNEIETKRCHGCGAVRPIKEMHQGTLVQIRQGRVMETREWYCNDKHCQGYDQMAHEG